jgi:hypothetical protein
MAMISVYAVVVKELIIGAGIVEVSRITMEKDPIWQKL